MYLKLFKMFIFSVLAVLIAFPGSSLAFKSLTRDQLVYDAIELCPTQLKEYLRSNLSTVSSGMHFQERHRHGPYSINPYDTEIIFQNLIKDLKEGRHDEFNTAHAFGVLACFLAETISPDNYKTPSHLIPLQAKYDGFQRIDAASVKPHIAGLIENYRVPCRMRMKSEITDLLYNIALNEIVDYWVSAWEASGFQSGTLARAGQEISHKNLVLNFKLVG
ncbi:MAG: hypothetical protein PVH74_04860 [Desulfobacterales bacterium]|jgi:hypothetical protein|nr:hypothetical protein [Deltaproteobacteria bacterium]